MHNKPIQRPRNPSRMERRSRIGAVPTATVRVEREPGRGAADGSAEKAAPEDDYDDEDDDDDKDDEAAAAAAAQLMDQQRWKRWGRAGGGCGVEWSMGSRVRRGGWRARDGRVEGAVSV